jgi:hypothetical protein
LRVLFERRKRMTYKKLAANIAYAFFAVGIGILTLGVKVVADVTLWVHRHAAQWEKAGHEQIQGLLSENLAVSWRRE